MLLRAVARNVLEEGEHAIVVRLRDGVCLVIVAAGAVDRRAEERLRRGRDDVVKLVEARLLLVRRLIVPEAETVVARRDDRVRGQRLELVTGDLLLNEPVVGLVRVEGADHVVAVAPSLRLRAIALVAVRLGVADEVEPVPPPFFAVPGR